MCLLLEFSFVTDNSYGKEMWISRMVWFVINWVNRKWNHFGGTSCLLSWYFNKDCQSLDWSHSYSFQSNMKSENFLNNRIYVIQYFGGDFPRANPAWKSLWTIGNHLVRPPANFTIGKIYLYISLIVLDPK